MKLNTLVTNYTDILNFKIAHIVAPQWRIKNFITISNVLVLLIFAQLQAVFSFHL